MEWRILKATSPDYRIRSAQGKEAMERKLASAGAEDYIWHNIGIY
jgi:hypothetical protein